jgi:Tubulin like
MKGVDDSSRSFKYPPNLTIVGLGGCGKKLAREICNSDWLLRYYSSDVNRLKIYTMDTDANEYVEDQLWEKKIMEKVDNLEGAGNIEFKSYYLPSLANITHVSDLTSAEVSASIKRFRSIKTWWLNDAENSGVTFQDLKRIDHFIMDDFGGGVHRRRAVSKAILYKVLSEGQANGFPTFSNPGVTAIILGIGGGTGSGMFIDLARYIKEKRDDAIYLFAVLPTTKEGEKEQLNAAISLTELEYLNVSHEERLFDHVIFTSLGPTEYTNGQHELEAVGEFDSVFPQIITNFFHIERSDLNLSDARKSYSSFIFADSHVIEYPVEELKELKEQYSQIIQELGEINSLRKSINGTIESLLAEFNITGESIPTLEVFEFVKTEYRNIEKVWTNNIAKLLNYHSVEQIEEFIKYNISEIQFEKIGSYNDLISYISRVNNFAQGVAQDKLKDEIDKKLFRLIPEALDTLKKNASLFKRVATVENEECRSVMIDILKGKKDISPLLGALNAKNQEIQTLYNKLKPTDQKMAELNSLPILMEKKVKDKLNDIDLDLEHYAKINRNIKYLPDQEQKLKETLDRYIEKLSTGKVRGNDKNSWFLSAGTKDIRMEIEAISKENEYDLESLSRFIDSITNYYFYKSKLKEVEKGGLRALILGKRKQLIKKYKENAGKEEDYIKSNIKHWAIRIDTPFNIAIPGNFLTSDLFKKAEKLREGICNSIFADLNITSTDSDNLNQIFASDDRVKIRQFLREYLTALHLNAANYFYSLEELNKYIEDLNKEIEEKKLQYDMLVKVDAANTETFPGRRNFSMHYEFFHAHFETINKKIEAGKRTKKGTYITKFGSVNPQILSLVEGRSDKDANPDMGNLDMDKNGKLELDKLVNLAKSTYQNLFESRKLGVNSLKISIGDTERWTFGKAALVVSSTSGYVRSELMKSMISTDINQSLSLKKPNDSLLTPHGHTKPWEIALTFFAASSFLDNIYPLVAGGGYWEIYARNKENILHHVLKLQDGEYITRNTLLDSETAGKIANNERRDEIPEEIMGLYKTKLLKEALKIGNE